MERDNEIRPDANESMKLWREILGKSVDYNHNSEWLTSLEKEMEGVQKQVEAKITVVCVAKQLKKTSNWKAPGPDGVQGYWLKKFTTIKQRIAEQLDCCPQQRCVPNYMTSGRIELIAKDKISGSVATNFIPITCLPLMWKLFTGILREKLYQHLDERESLPEEQKGYRKKFTKYEGSVTDKQNDHQKL